ncbi:MAG: PDZ domain-containing protein [Gemmatimonadaceae bacterium]|nr:PDZ domain-containing protein [Gemmatimonadaceae bacterium]
MADVMRPGERLPLRIRRRGSERVMNVVVEAERFPFGSPAVTYYDSRGGNVRICWSEDCSVSVGAPRVAPNIDIDRMPGMTITSTQRPASMRAPTPAAGGSPRSTWLSSEYSIAGAAMTTVTTDLEELTGADEGILVLRVAPGTPAASSGLRGGDVIMRINDDAAETVRDLQQAVQQAASRGERRVPLVVSRKQRERSVTLQW